MKRSSVLVLGLGLAIISSGCTRPVDAGGGAVTALNLKTGATRTFASSSDVPGGWVECSDDSCSQTPPGVPCQNLGPAVCAMFPDCRLKETSCWAEGCAGPAAGGGSDGTDGAAPGAPTDPEPGCAPSAPVCEYTCIAKYPLLCEELTSQQQCGARSDCDWGQNMCPMMPCDNINGCPPCPESCSAKQPPSCGELDEPSCGKREDCAWQPGACPACYSEDDSSACGCRSFCQPKGGPGCPEIYLAPPTGCDDPQPQYDHDGCLVGYACETVPCPAIAYPHPGCPEGQKAVEVFDARGCQVGYKCVAIGDCSTLTQAYAQALAAAKACLPDAQTFVAQCAVQIADSLVCGCTTFVNGSNGAAVQKLKDLQAKWNAAGCARDVACGPCWGPPTAGDCQAQPGGGGMCQDLLAEATTPSSSK